MPASSRSSSASPRSRLFHLAFWVSRLSAIWKARIWSFVRCRMRMTGTSASSKSLAASNIAWPQMMVPSSWARIGWMQPNSYMLRLIWLIC